MENILNQAEASSLITSLQRGIPPRLGLQYIVIGREKEIEAFMEDFNDIKQGQNIIRFWIGDYGIGKSFLLHILKLSALKLNFVVMHADMSNNKLLYDQSKRRALNLFSSLMHSISIDKHQDGNTLEYILDKWIKELEQQNKDLNIEELFNAAIKNIKGIHQADFIFILKKYLKAYLEKDIILKQSVLKWLHGDYTTITNARRDIDKKLNIIISNSNYYEIIKLLSVLFKNIGYQGLMVNLDEASTIVYQPNKAFRNNNYEKLLHIYNDLSNTTGSIYFNITGTDDFLEDRYKGLKSHGALITRLEMNPYENSDFRDFSQPMVKLLPLSNEEIFVLLKKVKNVYNYRYKTEIEITDSDIETLMQEKSKLLGAKDFLTPRELIITLLQIMNMLRQNPELDKSQLIKSKKEHINEDDYLDNISVE